MLARALMNNALAKIGTWPELVARQYLSLYSDINIYND